MCIFCCTFGRRLRAIVILCIALNPQSGNSSGATLGVRSVALLHARCSPYSSSERTCNNELTLFVRVAVVLPLPTKPRALREPDLLEIFAKWGAPYHSPQIANYEQVPIGYLMTMR